MDVKDPRESAGAPGPEPGAAAEISPLPKPEASAAVATVPARLPNGRFPAGVSGNPKGKPPGIPNRNSEFVKLLNKRELRWCWNLAKKRAQKGKFEFLEFLLERALVKQSPEAAGITLQVQQNNNQSLNNQETHVRIGEHLQNPAVRGSILELTRALSDGGAFAGGNGHAGQ